jgi:hypothetical protein
MMQGTYMLSNLLQELALARDHNRKRIILDESRLTENPVDRLSRMIKNSFWNSLTRRIDGDGLEIITADPKNRTGKIQPRIYVPHGEPAMAEYYRKVAKEKPHMNLDVVVLPPKPDDPEFVKSLNGKPGLLALAMNEVDDGKGGKTLKGIPFIVPGARFNEVCGHIPSRIYSVAHSIAFSSIIGTRTSSLLVYLWTVRCRWPRAWSTTSSLRSRTTTRSSTAAEATTSAALSLRS